MNDRHTETFIQEAYELLEVLETSLLELEVNTNDEELIQKIFRALHTIKGSGGMFGYVDVASFVHDIETVYDNIRNHKLEVNEDIIELTLKACDVIKLMINKETADENITSEILTGFRKYTETSERESKPAIVKDSVSADGGKKIIYHIFFEPDENILLQGTNPMGLLKEFNDLGKCFIIPETAKIPPLSEYNPEKLYTSWNIFLSTAKGIDSIKDIFIFVDDTCRIEIKEIDKGELSKDINLYLNYLKKPLHKAEKEIKTEKAGKIKPDTPDVKTKVVDISSIRVNSDKLDLMVNLVGELVTVQARLTQSANAKNDPEFMQVAEIIERLTWELRENALNIRMLPIGSTFNKFNRLVRDLSKELGKKTELITDGGETELDKNVIERLNDPLVHIIRNCIDHGIENPEERKEKGKDETGHISLSALHSGTHVHIKIKDDGAGLDKDAIFGKAVERGLVGQDAKLSDKEIYGLIFKPGFSTAKEITNVSGRGVGLDVVKSAVEALRGSFDIESNRGTGTTITLKLPLTLAIIEGLIIRIDEEHFVIPLSYVEECIELKSEDKRKIGRRKLLNVRDEIVPFVSLREKFDIKNNQPEIEQVVIINNNDGKTGLLVDEIIGEHQTVIKSLGKYYKNVEVLSGATVLGNGTVALIMDVPKIIEEAVKQEELAVN